MSNEEKLERLKAFLKENKIKFEENKKTQFGFKIRLKVINPQIAVMLSDDDKEYERKIYLAKAKKSRFRYLYHPFFIRKSESLDFIIEKMTNCITENLMLEQKKFERQTRKVGK